MIDDIDPLREYQRIVRATNLMKLQMASLEKNVDKARHPSRFEESRARIEWEIETLKTEGEEYLRMMRERPRR
jgi:hypothetical protein